MLTEYIEFAMQQAVYELLEDGTFYEEIPPCQGVYSNATTLRACQVQLQEVLEEWLILSFKLGHEIPVINGVDLNLKLESDEVA